MSLSIEELDATVRAFYEGRGETVRIRFMKLSSDIRLLTYLDSKNKPKPLSIR